MVSKSDRIFGSELIVFLLRGSVAVLSKSLLENPPAVGRTDLDLPGRNPACR